MQTKRRKRVILRERALSFERNNRKSTLIVGIKIPVCRNTWGLHIDLRSQISQIMRKVDLLKFVKFRIYMLYGFLF